MLYKLLNKKFKIRIIQKTVLYNFLYKFIIFN